MAIIFEAHNESDLSEWTSTVSDDTTWSASAALAGTSGGILITVDDTTATYALKSGLNSTTGVVRARFYFDPNSLTMTSGDSFWIFRLANSSDTVIVLIFFRKVSATYNLDGTYYYDGGNGGFTEQTITDAPHYIEVKITRATNSSSSDGTATWWLDGSQIDAVTGIDNYDQFTNMDRVNAGAVAGLDAGTSGTFFMDEVAVNDDGGEIGPYSATTNITPAEATQAQTSDAATINAIYPLTPAEATQAQTSDTATLGLIYPITPAEATQAQASDAATLTVNTPYILDDIILEWVADTATIATAEATQAQASDAASLKAIYLLTPGEATQAQISDAATLGQFTPIAPAEATQSQTSDAVTIRAISPITPAESTQAQTSDAVTLTAIYPITPAEATQSQTSDTAVVTGAGTFAIAPAEATQAQASDSATITAVYPVTVSEATQTQTSDAAGITYYSPGTGIIPAEATQAQTSDAVTLAVIYVLAMSEATQAQLSDLAVLTSPVTAYPPGNRSLSGLEVRANSVFGVRQTLEVDD